MCSNRMEPRWIHSSCWLPWVWQSIPHHVKIFQIKARREEHHMDSSGVTWHWPEKWPASGCSPRPGPCTSAGLRLILCLQSVQLCNRLDVGWASHSGNALWNACEGPLEYPVKHPPLLKNKKYTTQHYHSEWTCLPYANMVSQYEHNSCSTAPPHVWKCMSVSWKHHLLSDFLLLMLFY